MTDDLATFFAKKSNKKDKKKKSGVINIQDVGHRLERKAKRNELEEYDEDDEELVSLTKTTIEPIKTNNNIVSAEDSEWIDFNNVGPTLADLKIRELQEHEEESEDYEKAPKEPSKGWNNLANISEKDEVAKENIAAPKKPETYKAPGTRIKVDISSLNSELAFPSLAEAPKIEKEIRKIEEQQKIEDLKNKRREEEVQKRKEEERAKRNEAMEASGGRPSYGGRTSQQRAAPTAATQEKQENEEVDDWRSKQSTPKPQTTAPEMPVQQKLSTGGVRGTGGAPPQREPQPASKADEDNVWRRGPAKPAVEVSPKKEAPSTEGAWRRHEPASTEQGAWRKVSTPKAEDSPKKEQVEQPAAKPTGRYVPPSARRQM